MSSSWPPNLTLEMGPGQHMEQYCTELWCTDLYLRTGQVDIDIKKHSVTLQTTPSKVQYHLQRLAFCYSETHPPFHDNSLMEWIQTYRSSALPRNRPLDGWLRSVTLCKCNSTWIRHTKVTGSPTCNPSPCCVG